MSHETSAAIAKRERLTAPMLQHMTHGIGGATITTLRGLRRRGLVEACARPGGDWFQPTERGWKVQAELREAEGLPSYIRHAAAPAPAELVREVANEETAGEGATAIDRWHANARSIAVISAILDLIAAHPAPGGLTLDLVRLTFPPDGEPHALALLERNPLDGGSPWLTWRDGEPGPGERDSAFLALTVEGARAFMGIMSLGYRARQVRGSG